MQLRHAVGGITTGEINLATVVAYDPATNTWTTKAPLSRPRNRVGVGVVNGRLYAIAGDNLSSNLATVEAYDPATNIWTADAPLSTARSSMAVVVVNSILYAVGGYGTTYLTTLEAYMP